MLLNRGHILLNTTHAGTFCITGLEAASCGLVVVSTNVDGIGEVLPAGLAYIAKPETQSLTQQLLRAIRDQDKVQYSDLHQFVKDTYSWHNVAERTERVYNFVMDQPVRNSLQKLKSVFASGPLIGFCALFHLLLEYLLLFILNHIWPLSDIDVRRNFNQKYYNLNPHRFGDHDFRVESLTPDFRHEATRMAHGYQQGEVEDSGTNTALSLGFPLKSNRYCTMIPDQ